MSRAVDKTLITILLFALVLTCAFSAFFGAEVAKAFAVYDDKSADDLWYYGASYLNLSALKTEIGTWDLTKASANPIVIAVVDTGVNTGHSLFTSTDTILKDVEGNVKGYNSYFAANVDNPTATQLFSINDTTNTYHGTAVAGIMAMLIGELGLSDYIKLYPIKASNSGTPPSTANTQAKKNEYYLSFGAKSVIAALEHVTETKATIGADVVNMSLTSYTAADWDSEAMRKAISDVSTDSVLVAAAGNGDSTATSGYSTTEKLGYPASCPGVLSVMGYMAGGKKSAASNYGDYDVIAPGTNIWTAYGSVDSYNYISGSSMASAFVSVTAALLKLRNDIEVANGGAQVTSGKIANHIRTSATSTISYVDDANKVYELPKHSILESLSAEFDDSFLEPRGISVDDEGIFTEGAVTMIADAAKTIKLSATLLPYGATNPSYDESIKWYLIKIGVRNLTDENGNQLEATEEYEESKTLISNGRQLSYTPSAAGTYEIRAEYVSGENTFTGSRRYTYYYQNYSAIANGVKVVLTDELDSETQRSTVNVLVKDKLTFTLNYLRYVDPTVETKWYVNGEYAGSGVEFEFAPSESGEYEISAQYGDYAKVVKTCTVLATKPDYTVQAAVAGGIAGLALITVLSSVIVFAVKKKKAVNG